MHHAPQPRRHIGAHRLKRGVPTCRCPYVVTVEQPHRWDCPQLIEQLRRLHAGRGGTR